MSTFAVMRGQVGIEPAPSSKPGAGLGAGPRLIVFHGSADATVHPSNAERIIDGEGGSAGKISRIEPEATRGTRGYTRLVVKREDGTHGVESWTIDGAQHAWSGGHLSGSYTDSHGPDASAAMVRFFLQAHRTYRAPDKLPRSSPRANARGELRRG